MGLNRKYVMAMCFVLEHLTKQNRRGKIHPKFSEAKAVGSWGSSSRTKVQLGDRHRSHHTTYTCVHQRQWRLEHCDPAQGMGVTIIPPRLVKKREHRGLPFSPLPPCRSTLLQPCVWTTGLHLHQVYIYIYIIHIYLHFRLRI